MVRNELGRGVAAATSSGFLGFSKMPELDGVFSYRNYVGVIRGCVLLNAQGPLVGLFGIVVVVFNEAFFDGSRHRVHLQDYGS